MHVVNQTDRYVVVTGRGAMPRRRQYLRRGLVSVPKHRRALLLHGLQRAARVQSTEADVVRSGVFHRTILVEVRPVDRKGSVREGILGVPYQVQIHGSSLALLDEVADGRVAVAARCRVPMSHVAAVPARVRSDGSPPGDAQSAAAFVHVSMSEIHSTDVRSTAEGCLTRALREDLTRYE